MRDTMTMDRSLCPICAWREDCKKKFKKGAGIHCPDFSRDLNVKNTGLEEELDKENKPEDKGKKKKGLFPL
jgi:hypothetical protein